MNKKKITILIITICVLLITVIGVTFAYLRRTPTQSDTNTISMIDCLSITLINETSGINLVNAVPISDAQGLATTPYKFRVLNTCPSSVLANISLEVLTVTNPISISQIKYSFIEVGETGTAALLSSATTNSTPIITGATSKRMRAGVVIPKNSAKVYELRLWINTSAPISEMNKSFEGKIAIEGSPTKKMVADNPCTASGNSYTNGQYTYTYISASQGWHVYSSAGVTTNPMTSKICTTINNQPIVDTELMYDSSLATSIDLSSLDTSNIVGMFGMFYSVATPYVDLSNFNTSNVTDMSNMFDNSNIRMVDLSSFDFSNGPDITNMFTDSNVAAVFVKDQDDYDYISGEAESDNISVIIKPEAYNCSYSGTVDIGSTYDNGDYTYQYLGAADGWKATQKSVTNVTSKMCTNIGGLPVLSMENTYSSSTSSTIDLSSVNTSNVQNMSNMFAGIGSSLANSIDFRYLDTKNVTNMSGMFSSITATTLDLRGFNISNVQDMSYMFMSATIGTLHLESFAFSNRDITDLFHMFDYASITKVYAGTSADANMLCNDIVTGLIGADVYVGNSLVCSAG